MADQQPDDPSLPAASTAPAAWRQRVAGGLFLVTGAGLVVHLLVGLPLWLTVMGGFVLAAVTFTLMGGGALGSRLQRRVRVGLVSGMLATLAYDVTRLLLVSTVGYSIKPFDTWRLFGLGLIGPNTSVAAQWATGVAFHVANGLTFATAFTIWMGERGPVWGIGFALVLEGFMLSLYPGWLDIRSYSEFAQVSVLGHLVYGSVLGASAQRLLGRSASKDAG